MTRTFARRVTAALASSVFFRIVLGFFVFEALWITFSARYPMAFDEDFHFGIIKIYAHHWLPFLPDNAAPSGVYGAVAHDPSYLFHYLMSFPYRLISAITGSLFWQVVFLRLVDVAMFAGALVLFRKFMLRTGVSKAFTHVALLLFVLVPIVPLVAGQVNYDNLLILLTAWLCVLTSDAIAAIAKRRIPVRTLVVIVLVCLAATIVKYAFLPFALAVLVTLVLQLAFTFRRRVSEELWPALQHGYSAIGKRAKIILAIAALILLGLWGQRYGVNLVRYHTPIPDCAQVLTVDQCRGYGPWGRDYNYAHNKSDSFHPSLIFFTQEWFKGMWRRMFFVINGNFDPGRYENVSPLPLPYDTSVAITVVSALLLLWYGRRLFAHNWLLIFIALFVLIYCGALFFDLYKSYKHTGWVVAINGRYLLPLLLPAAALAGRAWMLALKRRPRVKALIAIVAVVLFLQGGIFEFIVQSNRNWYWQNSVIQSVNNTATKALRPLAVGDSSKHLGP